MTTISDKDRAKRNIQLATQALSDAFSAPSKATSTLGSDAAPRPEGDPQ